MSTIDFHRTKKETRDNFYEEDVEKWLGTHNANIAAKKSLHRSNKQYYEKLVKNLCKEQHPKASVKALINLSPIHPSHRPASSHQHLPTKGKQKLEEEVVVGGIIKHQLEEELRLNPTKACMSPALILTERRRRIIIDKLMHGNLQDEDANAIDAHYLQQLDQSSSISTLTPNKNILKEVTEERKFQPEWKNYQVMRNRWKYLLPQTRLLVQEEDIRVPKSSKQSLPVQGIEVYGQYIEVRDFEQRRQQQEQRQLLKSSGKQSLVSRF
jgi:hypothetical protein